MGKDQIALQTNIFRNHTSNNGYELFQHKPPTAATWLPKINIKILKKCNHFVLCYIQSCVHIYGHVIQINVCKKLANVILQTAQ